MAAESAKEARKLEDEVTALEEQINTKERAAEEAQNQSNSRHKNLTQKRKREETNCTLREDDDASIAQQQREKKEQ